MKEFIALIFEKMDLMIQRSLLFYNKKKPKTIGKVVLEDSLKHFEQMVSDK